MAAHRFRVRQVQAKIRMRYEERMRERTRIGGELHDTLLQGMSGFALQLDVLSKIVKEPPSVPEALRELRYDAEQWLHDARESVWDLHSQNHEDEDFAQASRKIGEELTKRTAIEFRPTVTGIPRSIGPSATMHLLRIVQEAIRNAVRHSDATEIHLDLSYADPCLVRICIADNGCGFDLPKTSRTPGHWGLVTMRERAKKLGAEFNVLAAAGRGTRIEIEIPRTPLPG
jgi:signal transduction histidine kinase